jgi:hypothetical protein
MGTGSDGLIHSRREGRAGPLLTPIQWELFPVVARLTEFDNYKRIGNRYLKCSTEALVMRDIQLCFCVSHLSKRS